MIPCFWRWFRLDRNSGFEDIAKCFFHAKSLRYTNRKMKPSMFSIIGLGNNSGSQKDDSCENKCTTPKAISVWKKKFTTRWRCFETSQAPSGHRTDDPYRVS